jgi:hypothetical protein
MTGLLVLSGDPGVALGAATKQYVDAVDTSLSMSWIPRRLPTLTSRLT